MPNAFVNPKVSVVLVYYIYVRLGLGFNLVIPNSWGPWQKLYILINGKRFTKL